MKHIPIVLPPHKLEAVLADRATQVRIPLVPQPAPPLNAFYPPSPFRKGFEFYVYTTSLEESALRKYPEIHCPYGKRGDYLYVQEEWSTIGVRSRDYILKATTPSGSITDRSRTQPWQPATTMPKRVARLWLKVAHVTIERAHAIGKAGALCEGFTPLAEYNIPGFAPAYVNYAGEGNSYCLGARVAFKQWFISVYGQAVYDTNPWLWAISFNRIHSPL
ncbi:hypothetical protein WBJ53_14905 [Spirosoma sp. SC4-14]|uniref:hypothetical protein n=1 Tax=Spirosoma sp. SC4-14 TaxID=3128900 RepID=UPI0030D3BF9C